MKVGSLVKVRGTGRRYLVVGFYEGLYPILLTPRELWIVHEREIESVGK